MQRTYVPLAVLAALALVGLLVYGVVGGGTSTTLVDAVKNGERPRAPDRVLPRLGGGTGSLAQWRGKPVLVNFWASWCDPCEAEAPLLERAHRRLKAKGGTVLGVTIADATTDSESFIREHGLTFPSLRDVEDTLSEEYGRLGVPESFLVDREGRIVQISRGQVDDEFIESALRRVGA